MKSHSLFLKTTTIGVCAVFVLFGLLFATQLLTSERTRPFDWQTALFIAVIYITLFSGILIGGIIFKLLTNISTDQTFSDDSHHLVSYIRKVMIFLSISSFGILPKFYLLADADDAPGLMLLGLALVFLPFAGLVLMNVLIKILEEAIRLKKNDELTV
ncbi:DUF2975 domain-containing protein [Enterococcus sp. DIV1298c]|uniref:DUF2975 domain-containing protein n=1 Tax=Candidatus Enterococcus mangumiae TaxID=2230878 RepID=A0ABZ2T328_9ENTE|nr:MULTISPECIES: DUF2975 domain-containing protein [unclassified Enterococcus]MBO0462854.1 DUF2975 domain-containing protein [Enterococcus sp. DIV1298c]MBO0489523.1 DUF2975 domain-containing protein [Enterococcus sp. DIV1094]